ncbi:MAG: ABC transporter ATP-binding protein [Thermomicrobiales bacterium]
MRFAPGLVAGSLTLQTGRMAIQFAPALVIRAMFDALATAGRLTPGLWALIALLVGVALARLMILVNAIWLEATVNHRCSALVRTNLIARLYERPGAAPLPYPTGDILGRLTTDAWALASNMSFVLLESIGILVTLSVVALMASIDLTLTVVALLPLIGASVIANRFGARVQRYGRASRDASGQVSAFLRELFGGVQAVQVANAEARVVGYFGRLNETRQRAALQEQLFQGLVMTSLLENVAHIATGLVLLLAGRAMLAGSFTIGDFALFSYCLPILGDFILHVGLMLTSYKQAGVAIERTAALLDNGATGLTAHRETHLTGPRPPARGAPPEITGSRPTRHPGGTQPDLPPPRVAAWHRQRLLHPVARRIVVITGRVGAGKTTLLRAILGLLPATGEIRWNGTPVPDPATYFAPPRSSYTPQVPHLFSAPLAENILLGLPPDRLDRAIEAAVLDRDVQPEEGDRHARRPARMRLSGGQVQRTAAARMVAHAAEMLVCDDLSSALDTETEALSGRASSPAATAPGKVASPSPTAAPPCAAPTASWC